MLSVTQAANQLNLSTARVRALIKQGKLPARKIGNAWAISQEAVLDRLQAHAKAGRPKHEIEPALASAQKRQVAIGKKQQRAYQECKRLFSSIPTSALIESASSAEEASFYVAVSDFFLQEKQLSLIAKGVY